MKLKLKESIIAGGDHYMPPAIIDTALLKISDAEALVLVRRGTAEHYDEHAEQPAQVEQTGGPVVTHVQTIQQTDTGTGEGDGKPEGDDLVEGRLAVDGMNKTELVALAASMGLETSGKTKAELIAAIKAVPVFADKTEVEGTDADAGTGEGDGAAASEGGPTQE